ncbi:YidB family protein [Acidisoma sp.]|uniref:YidB family protein n=1 Tax=Acidisoma sp. TaxID=1872115 RepID=UPI003B00BCE5
MGLLETVVGDLMQNSGGSSPMGGVLTSLLGGQAGGAGQQGMSGQGQGQGAGMGTGLAGGGLGGILSAFEQAGLGHIAQSWVGNGPNQPVSPDQLQNVLGQDKVQSMASQAGMEPNDFLGQLAQHLPNAVHGMTPNGQLPEGTVSV